MNRPLMPTSNRSNTNVENKFDELAARLICDGMGVHGRLGPYRSCGQAKLRDCRSCVELLNRHGDDEYRCRAREGPCPTKSSA